MTEPGSLSRRSLIAGTAALAGAAALAPRGASAQASPPANAQLSSERPAAFHAVTAIDSNGIPEWQVAPAGLIGRSRPIWTAPAGRVHR
jgi:hypothetical protein